MVIYATVPFVTAGLAYLFIGEKPSRSTLIASAVALAGVTIMLVGSPWGGGMFGKFLAVIMSLSMACFTVIMRRHREVAMLPAMGASAYLCSFVCFWFASTLAVSASRAFADRPVRHPAKCVGSHLLCLWLAPGAGGGSHADRGA